MQQIEQVEQDQITTEQVFAKLVELERALKLKTVNEHSRELWGLAEIADYFGYSKEHTCRSITASPHFPKPIALNGLRGKKGAKKWVSGEVVAFCLRWKMK